MDDRLPAMRSKGNPDPAVYAITCVGNGKIYIGSTVNVFNRWRNHRHQLRKSIHHSVHLQRAWNKHGENAFVFKVIEWVISESLLEDREQRHIDKNRSSDRRYGFNMAPAAGSNLGLKWSEETRAKQELARTGRKLSDSHRKHIGESHSGSRSHRAKLDEEKVLDIKLRIAGGETPAQIARNFGVSGSTISSICLNRSWSNVVVDFDMPEISTRGENHFNSKLTDELVRDIKSRISAGCSVTETAKLFNVARTTISDIKHGRTWNHVGE